MRADQRMDTGLQYLSTHRHILLRLLRCAFAGKIEKKHSSYLLLHAGYQGGRRRTAVYTLQLELLVRVTSDVDV